MIPFLVLLGGLIAVLVLVARSAAKRRAALQALADAQGWTYAQQALGHAAPFAPYALFSQGHSGRTTDLLTGSFGGQPLEMFDYHYTTGSGKGRRQHHQTVVHFHLPALRLPSFSVRPEGVMLKLISAMGYKDIDFPEHPEFSKRFLLRGPDEAAVRVLFVDRLPTAFEALRGIAVDGGDGHLFVFRPGQPVSPDGLSALLTQASTMLRAFQDAVEVRAEPSRLPPL